MWISLLCGNLYCKAEIFGTLFHVAGKKQSLNVKTITKHLAYVVVNITLAKRQSSTVLHAVEVLGENDFWRKSHKCFLPIPGQRARMAFILLFPWERERSIGTYSALLFLGLKRGVTVFTLDNYLLFCPAFLNYCKH